MTKEKPKEITIDPETKAARSMLDRIHLIATNATQEYHPDRTYRRATSDLAEAILAEFENPWPPTPSTPMLDPAGALRVVRNDLKTC